jgi:hypothetical protein
VKDEALHQQYDHIRKFYSEPPDEWFLSIPYQYLSEKNMTCIVNDSIEAILLIYHKVKKMENFDGLKSSLSLLPESLTSPYESPLGN